MLHGSRYTEILSLDPGDQASYYMYACAFFVMKRVDVVLR